MENKVYNVPAELDKYVANIKLGDTEVEGKIKPVLENAKIFGVNLYEAGLAELVCKYFTELIAGVGAIRATLQKYTK
jgi:fructuronate reductase